MSDDAPDPAGLPLSQRLAVRVRIVRLPLLVLAAGCLLLWAVGEAEPRALAALFAAVTAALFAATAPDDAAPSRPRGRAALQPLVWPDTSMKMMAEALPSPCFITDRGGVVRYANRNATERFGPTRPGDPLSFKLRVPELLAMVDRAGRGEPASVVRFSERVPTERVFDAFTAPIRFGRSEGRADFVLVVLDERTELVRMERMRGDFIANASHELRTPLASLRGFVETLLGPARNDEVNRERFLRIMLEQGERMSRLIDDLLSLSRIEMKAHVRPDAIVDVEEVVNLTLATLRPLAAEAEIRFETRIEPGPWRVRGDRDELIQVVSNLVENAMKYGRDAGTVEVSLGAETGPDGAPGLQLAVRDDGPGIDPEHLPRLTERFYRADADRSRARKGTGLGLAIVKHIVNHHRGRLTIRSEPGEGATFAVWIETVDVPDRQGRKENRDISVN